MVVPANDFPRTPSFDKKATKGKKGNNMGGKQERKPFDADAVHDGAPTSLAVLLKWLREEGNYARWRGTNRLAGNTKEDLCREIMNLFHSHGLTHRTTRDVRNKMAELERSMTQALTWKAKVQSMPSTSREETRAGILKCCKLFDKLEPIMAPFMSTENEPTTIAVTSNDCIVKATAKNATSSESSPAKPAIRQLHVPIPVPVSPVVNPTVKSRPVALLPARAAKVATKEASPPPKSPEVRPKASRSREELQHDESEHTPVLERAVKKSRLRVEARRLSMEDERLKLELDRQQIQLAKEKALARQELRKAHVPEHEINRIFPYE